MRTLQRIAFASITLLAPGLSRADASTGTLDVATGDNQGTLTIDGRNVGDGAYRSDVPPGEHDVKVTRLGFKPFHKTVTVEAGKVLSVGVTLEHEDAAPPPPPPTDIFGGLYGGFFLGPSLSPTGLHGTLDDSCNLIGAVSCSTSGPAGFVLAANVGYTWDPIGVEFFGVFGVDTTAPSASFNGVVQPGSNPVLTGPARTEDFTIVRAGGMFALRARATIDGSKIRVAVAAGPGFGYHAMGMERVATTTDGTMTDKFAPPLVTYLAPAVSLEVTASFRLSKKVAVTAGLSSWLENAGNVTTQGAPDHYFLPSGVPLRTPSYSIVSGTQFYLWPFVGMQFGP
jgi:hypothetical protein